MDIFSGIGGLTKALSPWVRPVAYCENDQYAQSVLLSRIAEGKLPGSPIWDDVRTLLGTFLKPIDIIYGGFPCQDISVAGNGKGLEGKRSGLFSEIERLTKECSPSFVFLENVPAIRTRGMGKVIRAFTDLGYDCRWTCVSAREVGAPHLRKRWFLLAANSERIELWEQSGRRRWSGGKETLQPPINGQATWGDTKPSICRMDDGIPEGVDRLRSLGNAVVPLQAREAFKRLMGIK